VGRGLAAPLRGPHPRFLASDLNRRLGASPNVMGGMAIHIPLVPGNERERKLQYTVFISSETVPKTAEITLF